VKWILWLLSFHLLLAAEEPFQGYIGRPLDLLSLYLPADPIILTTEGYEKELAHYWPKSHILFSPESTHIDLLRINLDAMDNWRIGPLTTAKAIYLEGILYPYDGTRAYLEFKATLETLGFFLLTRWTKEASQSCAIFVRKDFFYGSKTEEYLKHNFVTSKDYGTYRQLFFPPWYGDIYFYIDNDQSDSVKRTLKTGHAYEGNLSILIYALTKPNTVAIDIGAHIGVHAVFMSRKTGPHGVVIAFEPNKKLYMEQLANMELNGCKNVISICKGLGDTYKTAYQRKIEIEQNDPIEGEGDTIDVVPLDAYHFNNVSFIKMDVENYEYFVFTGARETIRRNRPVILFECWIGYNYDTRNEEGQRKNFERVMSLVESYGYEIYVVYNCDFLAIPKEDTERLESCRHQFKRLNPKTYQGEKIPS
jgi:FkbM family methyltransferase